MATIYSDKGVIIDLVGTTITITFTNKPSLVAADIWEAKLIVSRELLKQMHEVAEANIESAEKTVIELRNRSKRIREIFKALDDAWNMALVKPPQSPDLPVSL